ncbi:MAG: hypothetical protein O7D36_08495 [Gammaproteobacteria bacterium]|nr:hypothetical protein [Gammaproteobacteria bacterium]
MSDHTCLFSRPSYLPLANLLINFEARLKRMTNFIAMYAPF